tara:strand:+ start:152 stop:364 length:213 start_codon:yes stop_codon:yes gene_type:complete
MKLKKSLKERTCSSCKKTITRLSLYGSKSKTILNDPKGQCLSSTGVFDESNAFPFRITQKLCFCEDCANG